MGRQIEVDLFYKGKCVGVRLWCIVPHVGDWVGVRLRGKTGSVLQVERVVFLTDKEPYNPTDRQMVDVYLAAPAHDGKGV